MSNIVIDTDSAPLPRVGVAAQFGRAASGVARHPLVWAALRRLVLAVPLLFIVTVLSFVLVSLTPGDAALEILGTQATPETHAALRRALGLDLPLYEQYWRWLQHAVQGDMGVSLFTEEPVRSRSTRGLPLTLSLIVGAAARHPGRGRRLGRLQRRAWRRGRSRASTTFFARGVRPAGVLDRRRADRDVRGEARLVSRRSATCRWPSRRRMAAVARAAGGGAGAVGVAVIAKQTREAMLDVLGERARPDGLGERRPARARSIFRHALRNAGDARGRPSSGCQAVGLLGGTVAGRGGLRPAGPRRTAP